MDPASPHENQVVFETLAIQGSESNLLWPSTSHQETLKMGIIYLRTLSVRAEGAGVRAVNILLEEE